MRKTIEELEAERDDLRIEADFNHEARTVATERWRQLQCDRRRIGKRFAEIAAIIADRQEQTL